ncbi:hypothetical protein PISL3812_09203 [Talaromyces islandicus]|uniref:PWWP domain-containing protein n=1 Tax=Talaromyces islandicus TaxID=28573 RepID=A0A0U1M967_TALIS|nr:hypothetical protein PISL3812_09203 [Talaromyces islandicus]
MSTESPAGSAVAATAGDSRPGAAETVPEPASNEAPVDQGNEKASTGEEQAEEQKKPDETATAKPAEVNGKDTDAADAQVANGTPSAKSSAAKRKSTGGTSAKKLNKKKSQQRITHLDAQPGEYYLARLKSFPPWPSIICDEEMLPQSLLNSRPVTTKQADGTYKEAYADGGKRVYDRTFPIMFLETNEFAWIPNTDLTSLDPESCKNVSEKGKQKQLIAAYKVAAEGHDLQHFKNLLADHQRAVQQEFMDREAAAAEKAALKAQKEAVKEEKKKKRKSSAAEADGEADADGSKKAKATKKRKKDTESDAEGGKPSKTPKTATKLKLTTPKDPNAAKETRKTKKSAKPVEGSDEGEGDEESEERDETPPPPEPPKLDPKEAKEKKQKEILFIRHRLQKGFLSREEAPKEKEMEAMAGFFTRLESHGEIEVSIIRETKIQKVLRAILKLSSIPKDEQYSFKKRAVDILSSWKNLLDSDVSSAKQGEAKTNGVNKEKDDSANPEAEVAAKTEPEEAKEAPKEVKGPAKEGVDSAEDKDVPMPDAESGEKDKAEPELSGKDVSEPVAKEKEAEATDATPA